MSERSNQLCFQGQHEFCALPECDCLCHAAEHASASPAPQCEHDYVAGECQTCGGVETVPPAPNYQNAYTHAVQEYNKHQPALPAPTDDLTERDPKICSGAHDALKDHFKNSINLRPPQQVHVGKGDVSTEPAPPAPAAPAPCSHQQSIAKGGGMCECGVFIRCVDSATTPHVLVAPNEAEQFMDKWRETHLLYANIKNYCEFAEAYAASRVQVLEERLVELQKLPDRFAAREAEIDSEHWRSCVRKLVKDLRAALTEEGK